MFLNREISTLLPVISMIWLILAFLWGSLLVSALWVIWASRSCSLVGTSLFWDSFCGWSSSGGGGTTAGGVSSFCFLCLMFLFLSPLSDGIFWLVSTPFCGVVLAWSRFRVKLWKMKHFFFPPHLCGLFLLIAGAGPASSSHGSLTCIQYLQGSETQHHHQRWGNNCKTQLIGKIAPVTLFFYQKNYNFYILVRSNTRNTREMT